jgi:long-chain acyl-CoA synthetase
MMPINSTHDELQQWASAFGDKVAWMLSNGGDVIRYGELDARANRAAQLLLSIGLRSGDTIALGLPNCAEFLELCWAARRLGLYYTPVSVRLTPAELEYILRDCGAKAFFTQARGGFEFAGLSYDVGTNKSADNNYATSRDAFSSYVSLPAAPIGKDFVYSSGTTGRPKGIKRRLSADLAQEAQLSQWIQAFSKHDAESICLIGAPLYHAAPLRFAMRSLQHGGTLIGMPKFDAQSALATIERYGVTHSLWVPTMFYRLLALPQAVRDSYSTSSMKCAVHSGAPCAPSLKKRMIQWWGPVIWEYYAASEGNGATKISSEESLHRPGSVGKAVLGTVRILRPDGEELPAGKNGDVYFEGGPKFEYHGDPEKTSQSRDRHGRTTVGDIGHLDEDGYLYLSDRKAFTIISGAVNIYPTEIENALCSHEAVADAAVFGIPNAEYGEEVKAVVELHPGFQANDGMALRLMEHCRMRLSPIKRPKSISFEPRLPREENGKLYKSGLKAKYSHQSTETN